jgi:hypothetical protein
MSEAPPRRADLDVGLRSRDGIRRERRERMPGARRSGDEGLVVLAAASERSIRPMSERPRLQVLDVLESYALERDFDVHLERLAKPGGWTCILSEGTMVARGKGRTARNAILDALDRTGVDLSAFEPR